MFKVPLINRGPLRKPPGEHIGRVERVASDLAIARPGNQTRRGHEPLLHTSNLFRRTPENGLPELVPGGNGAGVIAFRMSDGALRGQRGDALFPLRIINGRCTRRTRLVGDMKSCRNGTGAIVAVSAKTTAFLEASPHRLASSFIGPAHAAARSIRARMSSTRQAVMRSPSLTGFG